GLIFALCLLLTIAAHPLAAQEGSDPQVLVTPRTPAAAPATSNQSPKGTGASASLRSRSRSIKVNADLVLVNVTVTDDWNRIVTGLDRSNFQVFEADHVEQIQSFSNEDAPISLGVIFDESGSMSDKIQKARDAVVEFFKTANPQDEFFMITFADNPQLLSGFTTSVEEIQNQLIYTIPKGRTALLDAIYLGMDKMRDAKNQKKALLIISDGGDNRSRYTSAEIKSRVREADVEIYAIGIYDGMGRTPEEANGPAMLTDIAEVTGGRAFSIDNANELADVASKIGVELRNQYVLGYRPSNKTRDGKWRKIKVKLLPPKGL